MPPSKKKELLLEGSRAPSTQYSVKLFEHPNMTFSRMAHCESAKRGIQKLRDLLK